MSSTTSDSPAPIFSRASTRASSAPTSPPSELVKVEMKDSRDGDATVPTEPSFADMDEEVRYSRLQYLLEKSSVYANVLKDRMDMVKMKSKVTSSSKSNAQPRAGQKRRRGGAAANANSKRQTAKEAEETVVEEQKDEAFMQPELITGAKLKDYQLEGVAWMVSLYENGISGILADEMGLGKTLQAIAFHAYLRQKVNSAFLIICPLSVLHNWVEEFHKFAPSIPVCMYHGTPAERAELRRTVMRPPSEEDDDEEQKPHIKRRKARTAKAPGKGGRRKSQRVVDKPDDDSAEEEDYVPKTQSPKTFPAVITTYEMIIKDRQHLATYKWGYIIVDEGHRLKNFDCKLMQEIKKYDSAGRMILTGTPLHNNLSELWSLLNFILPDIFHDLHSFQEWFDLSQIGSTISSSKSSEIITALHSLLKPFLLRRLKVDVEHSLPPKKEYVLYAPLTQRQKSVYSAVVEGGIRRFLIDGKQKAEQERIEKCEEEKKKEKMMKEGRNLRHREKQANYNLDGDDDEYFDKLEAGELENVKHHEDVAEAAKEYQYKSVVKQVNGLKLQNTVMQLRKVCSHPFLFDWPLDPRTHDPVVNEELVVASGKMMVLDRLLDELFKRGHKVLLFSQFTTMLDIIEAWALESKGWSLCRIDGSTPPLDRREQMNLFQQGGEAPDAPRLFLLSTRAGGLGINLTAADTVIFYDQDWNPQMDVQAQDRAHRIGQTKPVLIFRLMSAHTIETKIMQRATEKRQLEALVIAKGAFKQAGSLGPRGKETMAEIAASLLKLEGEKIEVVPNTEAGKANVLSDDDLDVLLDRRPEVFSDRGKGWTSAAVDVKETVAVGDEGESKTRTKKLKAAFEVFEAPVDEGSNVLARMMGEDVE